MARRKPAQPNPIHVVPAIRRFLERDGTEAHVRQIAQTNLQVETPQTPHRPKWSIPRPGRHPSSQAQWLLVLAKAAAAALPKPRVGKRTLQAGGLSVTPVTPFAPFAPFAPFTHRWGESVIWRTLSAGQRQKRAHCRASGRIQRSGRS